MKKGHRVAPEVKEQILGRIRRSEISIARAAAEHGVTDRSICKWLGSKVEGVPSMLEHLKLKRERDELLRLVGEITLKLSDTQKKEVMEDTSLTKSARAKVLGVSRSTLYYPKKQPEKDWMLKCRIEEVLRKHPSYGSPRIALTLGGNHKPVEQSMNLYLLPRTVITGDMQIKDIIFRISRAATWYQRLKELMQ